MLVIYQESYFRFIST